MLFTKLPSPLIVALACLVQMCGSVATAAPPPGKGGGNGGGDSPSAPVNYLLQRIVLPVDALLGDDVIMGINDSLEVVGNYEPCCGPHRLRSFYCNLAEGTGAANLDSLVFESGYGVPPGWYVYWAGDINQHGDIVGALARVDDPGNGAGWPLQLRGYVLELRPNPLLGAAQLPRLHVIPDGFWTRPYGQQINDDGLVMGYGDDVTSYLYRPPLRGNTGDTAITVLPFELDAEWAELTNPFLARPAQILSLLDNWVYTIGDAQPQPVVVEGHGFSHLGDNGTLYGRTQPERGDGVVCIYDGAEFQYLDDFRWVEDVNTTNDMMGRNNKGGEAIQHAQYGYVPFENLVVTANGDDQDAWRDGWPAFHLMSDRVAVASGPAADFPAVAGHLRRTKGKGRTAQKYNDLVVLVPVPAQ